MPRLLVIDDESSILHAFRRVFEGPDVELLTAETAAMGEQLVEQEQPDVVVLDLQLPDKSGLDCFRRIREIDAKIPVIFITGHGTVEAAIEATKLGAYDYLFKPLELADLKKLIDKAFHLSRMMRVQLSVPGGGSSSLTTEAMIGRCETMKQVYQAIGRVAPQDITVLLQGESGTGKELVARAVYQHSHRSAGSFRALNCAAIPETLLESELFGHEKGAFSGADRQRIGEFELASGGTLFLDEIGDTSPGTQAKLLRVLQEQTFERVGGNETIQIDVRVIAATNHDLEQLVAEGRFRSDLYYRLSGYTIKLPPLRERGDDIDLLSNHFVRKFSDEFGKDVVSIAPEALEHLRKYAWPGNIRELESVIKQSLLRAAGQVLLPEFLPAKLGGQAVLQGHDRSATFDIRAFVSKRLDDDSTDLYAETIHNAERELLRLVLRHTKGNQLQAAGILGISRVTLRSKIRSLGIIIEEFLD